ncbi:MULTISPECIES: sugar ABC transporter ATP-binding protein [unclassified Aureimonas]|uniref:sugar ABC transporter ATP-binding protein n=1 Tax=unclassified Aureimonas TaxID=2615206 RepID=UPI0006FE45C6|nr:MULTISPECIES: sugar ABC transporter ATP-binding protein [unclassified Aureimonas]KQT52309.1 ABC transporter ATP-binding protein [Aureimonas sp. Leaf427]KQT61805.1 ABC transporter ATP-binding protein [Aureimonas sp. Leaf460]
MTAAPLVSMTAISKSYGSINALRDVSFELRPGTVHALMGENGAGKSTLMKILAGVTTPTAGEIHLKGAAVRFGSPREALDAGISTVFQELSLLPNLTIAENLFLGREPRKRLGGVDKATMERKARETLRQLDLDLDPKRLVGSLSIAERQFVEIGRGITADADVVILDEPTAALNAADVEILNRHILALKAAGKGIVYISHRMEEIFRVCDTVSVLKDGRNVSTVPLASVTPKQLIALMVGRELSELFPPRAERQDSQVVLSLDGVRLTESSEPVHLKLHRGEIVALAGLEGQGQRELIRSIIGQHHPFAGAVEVKGQRIDLPVSKNSGVRQLQSLGVGFVPEDRKDEGLFLDLSVAHNVAIGLHGRRSASSVAKGYRDTVAETIRSMAIKVASPESAVGSLSGGNQQKALFGRYLALGSDILLVEEPTRGVDVGAKAEMYRLIRDFANRGGAALVLSRETLELIGLCDRIYVVHDRTIVGEMPAAGATEHAILEAALHRAER